MENTGIYHRSLVDFFQKQKAFVWVENPVAIKWSSGLQRSKTGQEEEKILRKACKQTLSALDKEIKAIDKELEKLVQARRRSASKL